MQRLQHAVAPCVVPSETAMPSGVAQGAGAGRACGGVARAGSAANLARLGRDQELRKLQVHHYSVLCGHPTRPAGRQGPRHDFSVCACRTQEVLVLYRAPKLIV